MNSDPSNAVSPSDLLALEFTSDAFLAAGVGLVYSDLMGHCLAANPAFCQLSGYRAENLLGKPISSLTTATRADEGERLHAALKGGSGLQWSGETRIRRADATTVTAICEVRAITRADGRRYVLSAFTDITEQNRRHLVLKERIAGWESSLNEAPMGIVVIHEGQVRRHNSRFAELFGLGKKNIVGHRVPFDWSDPTQAQTIAEESAQSFAAGQSYQTEVESRRADGSRFWAHLNGYAIAAGTPSARQIWLVEDRTVQRATEQQQQQAMLEQQAILDNSVLGICLVQNQIVRRCNQRMEAMFGYETGELVGRPTRLWYLNDASYVEHWGNAHAALVRGEAYQGECRYQRRDGSEFWVRESARALDPANAPNGSVWLYEDITARRETEAMLQRHRNELEGLVAASRAQMLTIANTRLEAEVSERDEGEGRSRHMARHDELTGLPNRALFDERLQQALATRIGGSSLAVLFIDLDRFKTINDTLGHGTGDMLLKTIAQRLQSGLRKGDTVARVGGDEFVIMLPGANADAASEAAERLLALIPEPIPVGELSLHITPSIGICLCPQDGDTPDLLLRHADTAMYQAKAAGRNGYAFFSESIGANMAREFSLENDLRRAAAQDEFDIHFQPIYRLADRSVAGLEALVRWRHPEMGLLNADSFIGVAEESGLIQVIGDWVFGQTCSILAAWRTAGVDVPKVAINLSVRQLWRPGLVARVLERLHHHGLNGSMIEFEITEETVMVPTAETLATLRALRAAGVSLALDDFGIGYSSLNYLRTLPVTKLKIDRTFVKDLEISPDGNPIVRAILGMAAAMGLSVVAEGIENAGQIERLRKYGCEFGQGYYLSAPLPAGEIPALLKKSGTATGF
jgi:diguanylate cyclase (GGDEF)-like protein/PAS domain S-box-containing protein